MLAAIATAVHAAILRNSDMTAIIAYLQTGPYPAAG
jgi:hypothetical protein